MSARTGYAGAGMAGGSIVVPPYRPRQHAATAHFPGGGPPEKTCGDCGELLPIRRNKARGRCAKWIAFKRLFYRMVPDFRAKYPHSWASGLPTIEAVTPACKYFVEKLP